MDRASPTTPANVYDEPGMRWSLRAVGAHLHPGSEDATVDLARLAERYGLSRGGVILDVASALGGPARYLARRFAATVLCIDMDPRMHAAAQPANRAEGLGLRVQPTLARCERLPLAAASCDAAWSQDALCHMDKPPVIAEVARVLRPGATFAFSDWIARAPLTAEELAALRDLWAFPSLLRLPEYVALLDAAGFDILYVEDTTAGTYGAGSSAPADQELWLHAFIQDFGEAELDRQRQRSDHWRTLVESGRTGNARFIARRRAPD